MKKLKDFIHNTFKKECRCGEKAVVECITYDNKKFFLCSNCLRSLRFREKEFFKSILNYD